MNLLSGFFSVPPPRRMLAVAGIASLSAVIGALFFFIWFDGVLATSRSLGSMAAMAERLAARGQYADAERLLRAALAIEEEHRFKVPFGIEARFEEGLRLDLITVLRKAGRQGEADAVARARTQP